MIECDKKIEKENEKFDRETDKLERESMRELETTNKPAVSIRNKSIEVCVWKNEKIDRDGKTVSYYNFQVSKSYKAPGKEWKKTNQFNRIDIPILTELLQEAYEKTEKNNK